MCTKDCAKRLLFLFNFLLWLGGAFLLGVGIWVKVDPQMLNYLHTVNVSASDPLLQYAAWVLMICGAVSFIVGIVGCCGAMREHQGLLFLYALFLILIMLAEIIGAVLALMYRNQIEAELAVGMKKQLTYDFTNNSTTMITWNYVQQKLKCCGGANFTDYVYSNWWNTSRAYINKTQQYVPDSCCASAPDSDPNHPMLLNWMQCQNDARTRNMNSAAFYTQGCMNQVNQWISEHTLILILVGFGIGSSQMLGLVIALCLRSTIKAQAKAV